MFTDGPVLIYYGDEIGLGLPRPRQQTNDEV